MKNHQYINYLLALSMLLLPTSSWAHTGLIDSHDLYTGFMHPLMGLDHLLTLFALGLLAVGYQPKVKYWLVSLFLGGIILGFALSDILSSLFFMEGIISLSVITLGVLLLFKGNLYTPLILSLVVIFACAHGYAHGIEITDNSVQSLTGLLASSTLIILMTMFVFQQDSQGRSKIANIKFN